MTGAPRPIEDPECIFLPCVKLFHSSCCGKVLHMLRFLSRFPSETQEVSTRCRGGPNIYLIYWGRVTQSSTLCHDLGFLFRSLLLPFWRFFMSCYNPLWAYPFPINHPKYGQYKILPVTRENCDIKRQVDAEGKVWSYDRATGEVYNLIRIPCGKCVGCRLDYAREWSARIVMESFDYPCNSLFVTLTYDDDHIPCYIKDSDKVYHGVDWARRNGELHGATLSLKDTQDWFKRLRRTVEYNYDESHRMPIRYYLAGEYGSKGHRPHYHVCLFGLPNDLVQEGTSKLGHPLYQSPLINETWGQGFTVVGELNATTASYTARYTLKKAQGQDHAYNDALGIDREFVTMSRKPGIGLNFYERHKDQIYDNDEIVLPAISKDKPNVVRPPRYFDIKFSQEDPVAMARLKAMRQEAQELFASEKLAGVQLNEVDYLEIQERKRSDQVKKLIRDL